MEYEVIRQSDGGSESNAAPARGAIPRCDWVEDRVSRDLWHVRASTQYPPGTDWQARMEQAWTMRGRNHRFEGDVATREIEHVSWVVDLGTPEAFHDFAQENGSFIVLPVKDTITGLPVLKLLDDEGDGD